MLKWMSLWAALLLNTTPAWADITARFKDQRMGEVAVEVRENGDARIATGKPGGYALLLGPDLYLVEQGADGAPTVSRVADVAAAIDSILGGSLAKLFGPAFSTNKRKGVVITPLGPRMVNGFKGEAYSIAGMDDMNPKASFEIVTSKAPELAKVGEAYRRLMDSSMLMAAPLFGPQAVEGLVADNARIFALGTPISSQGRIELMSITPGALDPKRFALPAKPMTVQQIVSDMKAKNQLK
jgi:hypothetical protein